MAMFFDWLRHHVLVAIFMLAGVCAWTFDFISRFEQVATLGLRPWVWPVIGILFLIAAIFVLTFQQYKAVASIASKVPISGPDISATPLLSTSEVQLEIIDGKHFENCELLIDGKFFVNCAFHNVTYAHDGGPNRFDHCKITGDRIIKTNNPMLQKHADFLIGMGAMPTPLVTASGRVSFEEYQKAAGNQWISPGGETLPPSPKGIGSRKPR